MSTSQTADSVMLHSGSYTAKCGLRSRPTWYQHNTNGITTETQWGKHSGWETTHVR